MRIFRLYLENYRVFEQPLDLEIPGGLVGIYGPNGAGKSYLIEAIPWILYGRSRTSVQDVRTFGTDKECLTELEFEHEGHHYMVSRSVTVRGLTKARVKVDNDLVADGVKETTKFMHSTLGMDIDSFRASVFAEQKQVAAFSEASPADRQKFVLALLGVTPLEKARDLARADSKIHSEQLKLARASLPDTSILLEDRLTCISNRDLALDQLEVLRSRLKEFSLKADAVIAEFARLESVKVRRDQIVAVGREKRRLEEELSNQVGYLNSAQARLYDIEEEISRLVPLDENVKVLEDQLADLQSLSSKVKRFTEIQVEFESVLASADCRDIERLRDLFTECSKEQFVLEHSIVGLRNQLRGDELRLASLSAELSLAEAHLAALRHLGSESTCPTCGQEFGPGFTQHLVESQSRYEDISTGVERSRVCVAELSSQLNNSEAAYKELEEKRAMFERLVMRAELLLTSMEKLGVGTVDSASVLAQQRDLSVLLKTARLNQQRHLQLLAEKAELERTLRDKDRVVDSLAKVREEVEELRCELKSLDFDQAVFEKMRGSKEHYESLVKAVKEDLERQNLTLVQLEGGVKTVEALLSQAQASEVAVEGLARRVETIGRVADFLNEFRRSVVAALGPRLAASAASLFSELTEMEYDHLAVDPDSWQIRICDSGTAHDLTRFSGSETDLANLAFRIAISEQIGHSFGQQVGLLVLDEVFGPLDDQRKFLMLGALERLKSRFNQVLVVTHGVEIKEQMPAAIEVVKLGRRRATARVA